MSLHAHRCCPLHGCAYSEKDCPVVARTERPGVCRTCQSIDTITKAEYENTLRILWKHREGEEKLAAANKALCAKNKTLRNQIRLLKKRAAADRRKMTKAF